MMSSSVNNLPIAAVLMANVSALQALAGMTVRNLCVALWQTANIGRHETVIAAIVKRVGKVSIAICALQTVLATP
jgi:Na+/H+ antiporter NhaD/arsenite permease-like protein